VNMVIRMPQLSGGARVERVEVQGRMYRDKNRHIHKHATLTGRAQSQATSASTASLESDWFDAGVMHIPVSTTTDSSSRTGTGTGTGVETDGLGMPFVFAGNANGEHAKPVMRPDTSVHTISPLLFTASAGGAGLQNHTVYVFRARLVSAAGAGPYSHPSPPMATLLAPPPPCCGSAGMHATPTRRAQAQAQAHPHSLSGPVVMSGDSGNSGSLGRTTSSGSSGISSMSTISNSTKNGREDVAITVEWGAVTGAVHAYEVQLRNQWDTAWSSVYKRCDKEEEDPHTGTGVTGSGSGSGSGSALSFHAHVVKGLTPNAQYIVRVRAINNAGVGQWSPVSARVQTNVTPQQQLNRQKGSHAQNKDSRGRDFKLSAKKNREVRGVLPF